MTFLMAFMGGFFVVASTSNPEYSTTAAVFFVGSVLVGRIDKAIDAASEKGADQ